MMPSRPLVLHARPRRSDGNLQNIIGQPFHTRQVPFRSDVSETLISALDWALALAVFLPTTGARALSGKAFFAST